MSEDPKPESDSAVDPDEPIVELQPFEIEAFFSSTDDDQSKDDSSEDDPAEDSSVPEQPKDEASPAAPSSDPSESSITDPDLPEIPGYHVEAVIGRGATGVVYRAKQTAVDRAVALKVLHAELITNRRAVKRLKREARLAAKLAHPSIISAIDMGSIGGLWWYAMELVEGVPLSRRIAERRSLSERECLRLFSPLCEALQHAHEMGVVHRDIKPANILIDQRGRARLVDLGLAMSENDPSITKTGSTLGTPHYVSPEQARDPSQADIRSDLWSLGATIYHAICGHPPFHSDDPTSTGVAEILSRVLYEPIVDPREFAPTLSKGFSLVLRKCLTRDPDGRYQEPWELVADIELLRERRRVDVATTQLDAYASRRGAWVGPALLATGLFVAMGGTWLLTARPWEEKAAPVPVEREARMADWPVLEAIAARFDSGKLTPADALLELETPAVLELPKGAHILRDQLEVDIRQSWESSLGRVLEALDAEADAALAGRQFQQAESISQGRLAARLRAATGFRSIQDLPQGAAQRRAVDWQSALEERVTRAHGDALSTAERGLATRFGLFVNGKLEADLEANRWRDALDWLNPSEPEVWLDRASSLSVEGAQLAAFDLSGFTANERRRVARFIDGSIQSAESEVFRRVNRALSEVRDFMQFQREELRREIEASTLRGEDSVVTRFDRAVEAKHASESFDVNQLPLELAQSYGDELVKARDDLAFAERRALDSLAERGIVELDEQTGPLLKARDYEAARALYAAARTETWRASTFELLDLRVLEMGVLQSVIERAAQGIEAARGKQRELTFEQIPRRGTIKAKRGEVLRLGFYFEPERGADGRNLIHLREVSDSRRQSGTRRPPRLLETEDVMAFAGLGLSANREVAMEPEEALAAAAFLCAEGQPRLARSLIRLEEYPSLDGLAADLERRSRRAATAKDQAAEAGELSAASAPEASPAEAAPKVLSAMEVFGTPNQASSPRDVRLIWRFAIGADSGPSRLKAPVPAGDARANGWSLKRWDLTAGGIELLATLAEVQHFAQDVGPSLPLSRPLDIDRRLRLEVDLVPGNERPDGHIVAISMRGHHALIARGKMWFGGGNLHDLYEYVRRGGRGKHEGFDLRACPLIEEDKPFRLRMELSPGALDRLDVNGKSLGFSRFQDEPDRLDSFVRIRSLRPMVITGVEVSGDRAH
jgi:serine/threonine protein kinase